MARGRKTALCIRLTPVDRQTLRSWQRSTTIPAGRARRGRIILQLADGVPISHIATAVGISRRFIYKWVRRYQQDGIAGLADKTGRGHRPRVHLNGVRPQHGIHVG
jgi:DNA invertase Pin-like site-specific DNA recombinase